MVTNTDRVVVLGEGECNSSFGEILQGVLPGNKKFLINLKVKLRSKVRLELLSCGYSASKELRFAESYRHYSKSYKVLRNILTDVGRHDDMLLHVDANIPVGKGLSSSTADMVASVQALERCLSLSFKESYVSQMITEIEPNDGLHYAGSCAYHHSLGELLWQSDFVPQVRILGVDLGGKIDTVEFNHRVVEWTREEMESYAELLATAKQAYEEESTSKVCEVATQSALKWQKCIFREELDQILAIMEETEALGVVNTHSGTYVGLLYAVDRNDLADAELKLRETFPGRDVELFESISC